MIFTVRPLCVSGAVPNLWQERFLPGVPAPVREHILSCEHRGGRVEFEFAWNQICCLLAFCRSPSWNIFYEFNQLYLLQRILSDKLVTLHRLPQSSNSSSCKECLSHSGLKFGYFIQQSKYYFTCMVKAHLRISLCRLLDLHRFGL